MLLGPRQTGKSTLVRQALPDALELDLLDGALHRRLLARPEQLADLVRAHPIGSDGLRRVAIEVKATRQVEHRDLEGLRALREEFPDLPCLVVAHEPLPRRTEDAIDILPVQTFFDRLWRREILPGGSETGPNHPSAAS